MSWTCGGCGERAATTEETATKGVVADRDPLERTSRVDPGSGSVPSEDSVVACRRVSAVWHWLLLEQEQEVALELAER